MSSFDLTKLGPTSFEHLVNLLALKVLGAGNSSFAPGADGGRDGLFEGQAPYPSSSEQWSGTWYIQSKYHAPNVSGDSQKWLQAQINSELELFRKSGSKRKWPDVWIVATNIDPSGVADKGTFDRARAAVKLARPSLASKFHIWGGKKILDLLMLHPDVAASYRHLLTPGHVIAEILEQLGEARASGERIVRHLVVSQFEENQHTRLEQAGASGDSRPGIQRLFIDVPYVALGEKSGSAVSGMALESLISATSTSHRLGASAHPNYSRWHRWWLQPNRARAWFLRGGPGRGKSTIGQYYSQIQRAALLLQQQSIKVKNEIREAIEDIAAVARKQGIFPESPRIPVQIDLKDYAAWLGKRSVESSSGILTYLSERLTRDIEQTVLPGTLLRLLSLRAWFVAFDGLDEVPQDVKDVVATNIRHFLEHVVVEAESDLFALCTSRPQGYSGQFSGLECATVDLVNLSQQQAIQCAKPLLELDRSAKEGREALERLMDAARSEAVSQLMTTPLQAHIMAIVVRDGGRPPERRWLLFKKFYEVIKRREYHKNFSDARLARLLREDDRLLKTIHNRLGFALQARAEASSGAESSLSRIEFEVLVRQAVEAMLETDVDETVNVVLTATTDRLVLVSTPEAGSELKFDVRQLQEYFAGEFLYESVSIEKLRGRLEVVADDSHWREAVQFCISALIEGERTTETLVASQVLTNLNSSHQSPARAALNEKLGRGALVAISLLAEGVLEQDKRSRHQFANCLESVLQSTYMPDISLLASTAQANSRQWLIEFLWRRLQERVHCESSGAALCLGMMLRDSDPLVESYSQYLLDSPVTYSGWVVGHAATKFRQSSAMEPRVAPPRWMIAVVVNLLLRDSWVDLLASFHFFWGVSPLFEDNSLSAGFREEGLTALDVWVLQELFSRSHHRIASTRSMQVRPGIEIQRSDFDWLDLLEGRPWSESAPPSGVLSSQGLFAWVAPVVNFIREPALPSLQTLASSLLAHPGTTEDAEDLAISRFIPVNLDHPVEPQLKALANLDAAGLAELISSHSLCGETVWPASRIEVGAAALTDGDVEPLAIEMPAAIASGLVKLLLRPRASVAQGATDLGRWRQLFEIWRRNPTVCRAQFFLAGKMFENLPASLQATARKLLLGSMAQEKRLFPWSISAFSSSEFRVFPFKLMLPLEAVLLPSVLECVDYGFLFDEGGLRRRAEGRRALERFQAWISEYVPDCVALRRIADDNDFCVDVRVSAAVLAALHPAATPSSFEILNHTLRDCEARSIRNHTLSSLLRLVPVSAKSDNENAVQILWKLAEVGREKLQFRQQFNLVINEWRERSAAPVSSRSLEAVWLAEAGDDVD